MNELLKDAEERKYALGQFTATCLPMIKPVIDAAAEEHSPVVITSHHSWSFESAVGVKVYHDLVETLADAADVPVVLHLDHGENMKEVLECLQGGFNSVMFDGSDLPLEENIKLTREVVEVAHAIGVPVEAEIEGCPNVEEAVSTIVPENQLTKPEVARRFVEETSIDILAVAIGQVHHAPKLVGDEFSLPKISNLNFDRLKAIREVVDIFLTLHASSHTPDDQTKRAIKLGVTKIGVGHIILAPFVAKIRKTILDDPDLYWPRKVLAPAQEEIKNIVKHELRVFGSSGKAKNLK